MNSRLKASLAAVVLFAFCGLAVAQNEIKTTDPITRQTREIGDHLKCQCGSCAYTISECNMLYCHGRDPVVQEIEQHLKAGMSPGEVISAMIAKYGGSIRTAPAPEGFGAVGWAMPFVMLALGFIIAPFVVRRLKRKAVAAPGGHAPIDPEVISRYEAEIEKDLDDNA